MGNVVMLCACLLFVPYLCIMLIMCPCMNFGDTYSVVSFFFRYISVALVFLTWMCMGGFLYGRDTDREPKWEKKKNLYDALPLFHWVGVATHTDDVNDIMWKANL